MRIFSKLLSGIVVTALFSAQAVVVASGQDSESRPKKQQPPGPTNENEYVAVPSFLLEIAADKTTARPGEALRVEVTLTNTSDRDLYYDPNFVLPYFWIEVQASGGKKLAGVRPIPGGGSVFAIPLPPGKSIRRSVRLDKEFKLDTPGNYFVEAVKDTDNRGNVKRSDAITITINP